MTVATTQVSESLQSLIDSRLDTIDRMLLSRLSRQDRLAIVREVESQIPITVSGTGIFRRDTGVRVPGVRSGPGLGRLFAQKAVHGPSSASRPAS